VQLATVVLSITAPLAAATILGLALQGPGPDQPPPDARIDAEKSDLIPKGGPTP
jgi:hypothetical protein